MYKVIKPFDFYHDGITPTRYEGECEIPEDALAVAQSEGWAEPTDEQPAANPSEGDLPEDAAAVAEEVQPKKAKK